MEAPFVPDSHEFSSFTNATRVTPREKLAKSYMFILDTPEQSSHPSVISHEEHGRNEDENRKAAEARHLVEAWSTLQLEVDLAHRAERRRELVNKYYDQYLGHLERLKSEKVPSLPIECEQCLNDLNSSHPSSHIQEYKQMMSSRISQSELGSKKDDVTDVNVAAFDQLTSHLAATIEEHEQKLQKLEKRLQELSGGRSDSGQQTDKIDQDPMKDVDTYNKMSSWHEDYSAGAQSGQKDDATDVTGLKVNEHTGYQLPLNSTERYLVTDDWLKFEVGDDTLQKQPQPPTEGNPSEHEGVGGPVLINNEEEDEDMPPHIRSVFLSNLVWDDDGDVGKRVDWQLRQYQKMAYKPRHRWSPKITIPQPFNMTIREYTKPKSETFAQQRMNKILENRDAEMKIRVKPTDIPKSTTLPKFQRIMEEKQKRSIQIREQSKENLLKSQRPFSFYNRSTTSSVDPSESSTNRHNRCLEPMDDIYL